MARSVSSLLHALATFQPHESWVEVDDLLAELWEQGPPQEALLPLFRFLERFPTDNSGGVLMGLVHGIETFPAYEHELVDSLRRQPTEMTLLLLRRLANTGQLTVAQFRISDVYREIQAHPAAPADVQKLAHSFLQ
jgi:hypothetical protein